MELKDLLEQLHIETAKALLERIKSGTAKAQDFQAAISLLKHNRVYVNPDKFEEDPLYDLKRTLEEEDLSQYYT